MFAFEFRNVPIFLKEGEKGSGKLAQHSLLTNARLLSSSLLRPCPHLCLHSHQTREKIGLTWTRSRNGFRLHVPTKKEKEGENVNEKENTENKGNAGKKADFKVKDQTRLGADQVMASDHASENKKKDEDLKRENII